MLAFRHGRWRQNSLWNMMKPLTMDLAANSAGNMRCPINPEATEMEAEYV
jgi:hypothetical protein